MNRLLSNKLYLYLKKNWPSIVYTSTKLVALVTISLFLVLIVAGFSTKIYINTKLYTELTVENYT